MSPVLRVTRSPVPARSTVDSGSDSTFSRKRSRSTANTFSASTNADRRASQVSTVWASTAGRPGSAASLSMCSAVVPSVTDVAPGRRAAAARPARPRPRARCSRSIQASGAAVLGQQPRACSRTGRRSRPAAWCAAGVGATRHQHRPPLGSRCAVRRVARQQVAVRARSRRPGRTRGTRRRRPGRAAAGWRSSRRSCRSGRRVPAAQPRGDGASVCASTELVGSTSTRTSASASTARARASRWRWPPEKPRPRLVDLRVQPLGQRLEHVARRRPRPAVREQRRRRRRSGHGSSSSRSAPVNSRGSVSRHHDPAAHRRPSAGRPAGRRRG